MRPPSHPDLSDRDVVGDPERSTALAAGSTVGKQIRTLRKLKRVTLQVLADRIGKSVGYLSEIERDIAPISISALQEIADTLGVNIGWFFQGAQPVPEGERDFVVRKGNRKRLAFTGAGVVEELLSPHLSGQLELIMTTFKAGSRTGDQDRIRRGEEAGVVLSGKLQLHFEGKTVLLEAGDSFAFYRTGPHQCMNPGDEDAVVLWVITPPSY
ncbi:XRE family transcriptional regulator [Cupriavidus sp. TA19]|nr:XRE family transcriptional regulator [Cupriavidus sp. TA19]